MIMRFVAIIITVFTILAIDKAFAFPDLMDIKHISSKGRAQNKEYNPDSPIADELIGSGISSIRVAYSGLSMLPRPIVAPTYRQ